MWQYKDVYGFGDAYVYIHPYKQKIVHDFVSKLPFWVDYIIVFGSSVMPYCRKDSDLDICIIGEHPEDLPSFEDSRVPGQTYDFLFYKTKEHFLSKVNLEIQSVEREIYQRGIIVYAKSQNITKTG